MASTSPERPPTSTESREQGVSGALGYTPPNLARLEDLAMSLPWPRSAPIVVPWPRWPTLTATGKVSRAKTAGRQIPWLSTNVVNLLPGPVYRQAKIAWRQAGKDAAWGRRLDSPIVVYARLYKRTAAAMDSLAVMEGLKPIIDGLEGAGLLTNDRLVMGGIALAERASSIDECRVELWLVEVTS